MATDNKKNILQWMRAIPVSFIRGDATPKLFFLILSVILWFLIKLSKGGYMAEISYPVVYNEIPSDKRLVNKPPEFLIITIRGGGFEILGHKLRSLRPLELSVGQLPISDTNQYRWDTQSQLEPLRRELIGETEILDIEPEVIFFNFSEIESEKVKVYLKGERKYSNFRSLYRPPELSPDSITVWGTKEQLAQIDSVFTEPLQLMAEEDSMSLEADLILPEEKGLEFSHRKVQVNLIYTSLTEGSVEVPVEVVNPPDDYEIMLVPNKVTLTYRVPIRDFSKIDASSFDAFADYQPAAEGDSRFLKVELKSVPDFVRKTSIKPRKVEYILTEK